MRFARRGQRLVERAEIEDPAQVDRLEQAERDGLRGVGRQRGRVRVVGEGDLLERRRDDARLERLAGVRGQFRVRVRLRRGRVGLDEGVRLDLGLEQVGTTAGWAERKLFVTMSSVVTPGLLSSTVPPSLTIWMS